MFRQLSPLIALLLTAGAACAQEREWVLDASDEDAYLIFGVPDSDDVGLSLWCPVGKGVVNLFMPVPTSAVPKNRDKATPITVTAGAQTVTFRGKAEINPEAAVSSVEAEIDAAHPLFTAMREADRFTVKTGENAVVFPLYEADLDGLLTLCKKM